jgi:hypothetical protein
MAVDMLENNELSALAPSRLGMRNFVNDRPYRGKRMPKQEERMEDFLGIGNKKKRGKLVSAQSEKWKSLPTDCESIASSIAIVEEDTTALVKSTATQKGNTLKNTKALINENQRVLGELKQIKVGTECTKAAEIKKAEDEKKFQENLVKLSEESVAKAKGEAETLTQKVSNNKNVLLIGGGVVAVGIIAYLIFKK